MSDDDICDRMCTEGTRIIEERSLKVDPLFLSMIRGALRSMSPHALAEFERGYRAELGRCPVGTIAPNPMHFP